MNRILSITICLSIIIQLASCVIDRPASQSAAGISKREMPQFILFTHDDNTDSVSYNTVTSITNKFKNPNGCGINAAFYTTSSESDCGTVKKLYNMGHEIAEHTRTHPNLHDLSFSEKKSQIVGARDWIIKCGIPKSQVVGHRSPFLVDDKDVRKILHDNGFLYDSSIGEYFNSKTSPSGSKRLFPYSFYKGVAQMDSCHYFDNNNHCESSEKYKGLYEVPMWMYQRGNGQPSVNNIMDPPNAYSVLKAEFDRNYAGNRAPIGIWTHSTASSYLTKAENRDEISKFLKYALAKPNTWVVTPRQLVDWVQNPVPATKMADFMKSYKCNGKRKAVSPSGHSSKHHKKRYRGMLL